MKRHYDRGGLASDLASLSSLGRSALLEKWQSYYKIEPPVNISRQLLVQAIAYRITATLPAESLSEIKNILGGKYSVGSSAESLLCLKGNIEISYKRFCGQLCIVKNGEEVEVGIDKQAFYPEDKTFIFIAKSFYWNKQIREGEYKYSRHISESTDHSVEYVKRSLLQRYLSPKILEKITSKENLKQIGVDQLMGFNHWCWEEQEKALLN